MTKSASLQTLDEVTSATSYSDFGHVVFYDTLESEYGHEWEYVYPIADSMSLFLQGLFPSPP